MHYWTPRINLPIGPVERFFEVLPHWSVEAVAGSTVAVDSGFLDRGERIVWLHPAR